MVFCANVRAAVDIELCVVQKRRKLWKNPFYGLLNSKFANFPTFAQTSI